MERNDLIMFLQSLNINQARYSFDRVKKSDCISLIQEDGRWNIYYTERDKPELIANFENECDANVFIANDFKRQNLD